MIALVVGLAIAFVVGVAIGVLVAALVIGARRAEDHYNHLAGLRE